MGGIPAGNTNVRLDFSPFLVIEAPFGNEFGFEKERICLSGDCGYGRALCS